MAQVDHSDQHESHIEPVSAKSLPNSSPEVIMNSFNVTNSIYPCGGGIDTLVASGACSYVWSSDSMGANIVGTGDSLIYGPFYSDTSVFVTTYSAQMESVIPLPAQTGTYSSDVRGYYFTAPLDMVITGLWVPTDASSANQTVEILRFDNQTPPPAYSSTTNAFTSLGYWLNHDPNDTIDVCIPVSAGDVIGIYGYRGTTNSYANGPASTVIGGITTPLERSGMQFPLTTQQMHDVWGIVGSTISRIEFFYDLTPDTDTTQINIIVPQISSESTTASICQGDSIMLQGAYQTTAGIYLDIFQSVYGCDSTIETTLSVNPLPTVSFVADTVCQQDGSIAMSGSPTGGSFTGNYVSGNLFDASAAGAGLHSVTYSFTDSLGCSNATTSQFVVENCAGINENTLSGVKVFPNPMTDELQIILPEQLSEAKAFIYDSKGRLIRSWNIQTPISVIDVSKISSGVYFIEIKDSHNLSAKYRVVKK